MKRWKLFFGVISALVLVALLTIFINQSLQLLSVLYQISPWLGKVCSILLLSFYFAAFALIIYIYWQMPKTLSIPPKEDSDKYQSYLLLIEKRLKKNQHLKELPFDKEVTENIKQAIETLDTIANEEIKRSAKKAFLFTSISQYGRLDGLIVFALLIYLTTRIAFLYNQRPGIKELIYLYINVFSTIFLVTEMENMEIIESQLEPFMDEILGSSIALAAGTTSIGAFVVSAIFQGTANAFLVMRIGLIARQYSLPGNDQKRTGVLHGATVQASKMLSSILSDSIKTVVNAFLKSGKKKSSDVIQSGYNSGIAAKDKAKEKIWSLFSFKSKKI